MAQDEMRSMLEEFPEAQLQIKDRLPCNFLIAQMVLTFQKAILNIQYSAEELREAAEGFVNMIPRAWKDQEFYEDLDNAATQIPMDSRPAFCDRPASDSYCRKHGIPTQVYIKSFDYMRVFNAVINLLNRRHMLLKPVLKEIMTGEKATSETNGYDSDAETETIETAIEE
jgi:hypothetical protein